MTEYTVGLNSTHNQEPVQTFHVGARLLGTIATAMHVDININELDYWSAIVAAARAYDDLVDRPGSTTSSRDALELFSGGTVPGLDDTIVDNLHTVMTTQHSARYHVAQKAFMTLSDFAEERRSAKSVSSLLDINIAEANGFADMLCVDETGPRASQRVRLNKWIKHFSRAGYIFDTATDLKKDADNGLIAIAPTRFNQMRILSHALPDTVEGIRYTPAALVRPLYRIIADNMRTG